MKNNLIKLSLSLTFLIFLNCTYSYGDQIKKEESSKKIPSQATATEQQSQLATIGSENKIYKWQVDEFKNILNGFKVDIEDKFHLEDAPKERKEIYVWQMKPYKKINNEFKELISDNLTDKNVPHDDDALFRWQLNSYKKIANTYKDVTDYNLERHRNFKDTVH